MSHLTTVIPEGIKDIDALKDAAEKLGLEMVLFADTFRCYPRYTGDTALPPGMTAEDWGKCHHKLRCKDATEQTYEVGLIQQKDGSYQMVYDEWMGGYGLEEKIGQGAVHLKNEYSLAVARKKMRAKGYALMGRGTSLNGAITEVFQKMGR
jgi:hypothetical protein